MGAWPDLGYNLIAPTPTCYFILPEVKVLSRHLLSKHPSISVPPPGRPPHSPESLGQCSQPPGSDSSATRLEPSSEPTPDRQKKMPRMAPCMELGASEYANSRPAEREGAAPGAGGGADNDGPQLAGPQPAPNPHQVPILASPGQLPSYSSGSDSPLPPPCSFTRWLNTSTWALPRCCPPILPFRLGLPGQGHLRASSIFPFSP